MKDRILIVDDEELQRMTMRSRLQSAGFTVELASGGNEALAKIREQPFDIVILDIRMPDLDGIEVLRRIANENPGTEVIMMTGFADFMTAVECLKNGARDYLVKPIHPTELVTRLNTLIRERDLRKSLHDLKKSYPSTTLYSVLSPLYSVTSIIEHVSKGRSGPVSKEQSYLLAYARKSCEKTMKTVQFLSGLSDPDNNALKQEQKPTDIGSLTESVCYRYEILARPKGLTITKSITRPLPNVQCDSERIVQALNNILDYSMEHSLSGGSLSISASAAKNHTGEGKRVIVSIRDSGIAIPGDSVKRIFSDKESGLRHVSSDLKLTEIGLAVSKQIIEEHGGRMDVEFETGSGNLFVVTLPAAE